MFVYRSGVPLLSETRPLDTILREAPAAAVVGAIEFREPGGESPCGGSDYVVQSR